MWFRDCALFRVSVFGRTNRVAKELQSEAKTRIYRKTERKVSNGQNKDEDTNKDIYR